MARPRKDGIDYFSFDTDFFSDKKIRVLKSRFGADGMMIYIYILCEVYKNGYYIELDDDYEYIIADDLGMSGEKVKQVLKFLLERSLLDSTLFQSDTIITSHGIQKRFQEAVKKRASQTPIEVDGNIWLLKEDETQPFIKVTPKPSFWGRNPSFCNRNPSFCGRNDTKESKVNESKINESIVKESSLTVSKDTVRQTQSVRQAIEEWNKLEAYGIACVAKLTADSKRYGMLIARLNQYGVDNVLKAIENIKHSDFLQGKNAKGWTITFDWFVKPNNFPKVLEGNYNNGSQSVNQSPTAQMLDRSYDMMMSWVEKKEAQGQ